MHMTAGAERQVCTHLILFPPEVPRHFFTGTGSALTGPGKEKTLWHSRPSKAAAEKLFVANKSRRYRWRCLQYANQL